MGFAIWVLGFLDGAKRVVRAPALLAGVFVLTFLLALPLALTLRGQIAEQLGRSTVSAAVADGVDNDWWQEFTFQASGLGATFTPSVIGFAVVLENIGGLLDKQPRIAPIAGAVALYLLGWMFLSGGIIDRYARQRPVHAHGFFSACGVYFFRFLRLGAVAGLVYWLLFAYVHTWLFTDWLGPRARELAVEKTAMQWRFGLYALFGLLLLAVNLLFDYAKIRAVVEDRRSMLGAIRAAAGFIRRNLGRVLGLYVLNTLLFALLMLVWWVAAPGIGGAGISMWLAFVAGQLYLLARLAIKLQSVASETALFQRSLAHAEYIATPMPAWPESPTIEAISRSA